MINHLLYNLLLLPALLCYAPFLLRKLVGRGTAPGYFRERLGRYRLDTRNKLAALKQPVWIHAVSVGEVKIAQLFIQHWQRRDPAAQFVLTTTTTTGKAVAEKMASDGVVVLFSPLDLPWAVAAALRAIRPLMLVIFEVEIWPNLLWMTKQRGVKMALVNCRLSDSSLWGYTRFRWFFRPLFATFDCICTQGEEDTRRIRQILGDDRRVITGRTMKFDQAREAVPVDRLQLLRALFGGESLLFTAASTHPGEEEMILEIFAALRRQNSTLKLILAPRHCERSAAVEKKVRQYPFVYTTMTQAQSAPRGVDILLVDTTGDLDGLIACSDMVYVGKSMCGNHGGQNIIEPAIFGKVILHGPAMENFRQVVDVFQREQAAIQVDTKRQLLLRMEQLLADPDLCRQYGERAKKVVKQYRGGIEMTLDRLLQLQGQPGNQKRLS